MAPKADGEAPKTTVVKKVVKKVVVKKVATPDAKKEAPKEEEKKEEEIKEEAEAAPAAEEEAPPEPEEPKEKEEDAAADSRKKVAASDVEFNLQEGTLNVLPSINDKLLMSLTDGGFQYLMAGVRCTAGLKAGRYMFEVKIVESLNPTEPQGTKSPAPKQLVRVGLSEGGSTVFLTEGLANVCFDSEGFFTHGRKRSKVGQKFTFGETVAVLVNLDQASPNANTISLFKDGVRASEPQALPDNLKGKVLYPTVSYKNVTLRVNFGPKPMSPLPFACRMVKDAAADDVQITKASAPKGGKYEVLFPIGMPDEGVFEWTDQFLTKNPTFTEISDRKIVEWALKSNIQREQGQAQRGCADSPEMNFGIPLLDDLSVRKLLNVIAPTLDRNLLVMDLKANLIQDERKEAVARFADFNKVAVVAMGDPSADYVEKVHADMLAEKKKKADEAQKKKEKEEERKRLFAEKKRKAEEARKAKLAERKAKEGKKEGEEAAEETKEEEVKAEEEEKKEEEVKDEKMEPEVVELTEEEKALKHRKQVLPDLSQATLAKLYARFTLPESTEGFDEVRYVWEKQAQCAEKLNSWIHERKMTQRVEDLTPGEWFKELWSKWIKTLQDWKKKQSEFKDPAKKKALLAKKKKEKEEAKKAAKAAEGEEKAEGEEEAAEEAAEEEEMEINADDLDVFAIEDVCDIGNGEPLFHHFAYEDWTLLSYRMEFHLMLHAWKKDVSDADRPSFKENHMPFYYSKYFKKQFQLQNLGVESLGDFIEWIKDSVLVNDASGYFEAQHDEDTGFENFLKLAEDHRRDRQRRVDAGDETAKLKFARPSPAATTAATGAAQRAVPVGRQGVAASPAPAVGIKRTFPAPAPGGYGAAASKPRIGGVYGAAAPLPRTGYGAAPARPMGTPYGTVYGGGGAYGAVPQRSAYGMAPAGKGMYGAPQGGVYGGGYYRQI